MYICNMITKEQYDEAYIVVELYEQQEYEKAEKIAESIEKDIREYTKDKYWTVGTKFINGKISYDVTNKVTYDEDYGGYYDKFIERELGQKYGVYIYVTGIYGK